DRLDQGVGRDWVPGVVLSQLQKPQRELVAELVHLADELQSLLVGQDSPARRRILVLLEKRLVLFGWGGRPVLGLSGLRHRQTEPENQDPPKNSWHGCAPLV